MTYLVPFDGTEPSTAVLRRASDLAAKTGEPVRAVVVIPQGNAGYARDRGWIDHGEPFDRALIVDRLRERIERIDDGVALEALSAGRYVQPGTIAGRIRRHAREIDASVVFLPTANAGRMVSSLSSVSSPIAAGRGYDVYLVSPRAGDG